MSTKDTSREAERIQIEILRRMSPERKIKLIFELIETEFKLLKEGISARHPEYDEKKVNDEFIKMLIGEELFADFQRKKERRNVLNQYEPDVNSTW